MVDQNSNSRSRDLRELFKKLLFCGHSYCLYTTSKTDGYHRPSIFPPSHFRKEDFCKDENLFLSKKHAFSIIFFILPPLKIFWFLAKNLLIEAEKTFLRNDTIWYAFYSKFATFSDFEKSKTFF